METEEQQERRARAEAFGFAERARKRRSKGVCLHPQAGPATCSGSAIAAHTIQRNGGLLAIADKNKSVLTVIPTVDTLINNDGANAPRLISIKDASTFPGFCNKHDHVFAPIEGKDFILSDETAFLFAYRSISMELFGKLREKDNAIDFIDNLTAGDEETRRFLKTKYLPVYQEGIRRGLVDLTFHKNKYDKILASKDYSRVKWLAVEFDDLLPIVVSTTTLPEFDFKATRLQNLLDNRKLDGLSINVTSYHGRSVLIFVWLNDAGPAPSALAESFVADVPDAHKANAIICASFELAENTFINPAWWEARSDFQRTSLMDRTKSGSPAKEREANCLQNFGIKYSAVGITSVSRSA